MNDGSIRVGTKLDTKETHIDLKKLEKECEKTAQKIEQAGEKIKTVFTGASKGQLNSAFKTANKELEKTQAALAAVEDKIKEIQAQTDKMLPEAATDEQAANLLAIEESESAPLLKQREELTAKAAEYKRQMEAITAELNKQAQAEAAQNALKTGAKDAVADAEWLGKIKTEQEYNAVLEQTQAKMAVIEQEAARIAQLTGVPVSNLLQQNSQYQTLVRRAQLLTANQANFKGKVTGTEKEVRRLGNTMTRAFDKGLKRIMRMSVGVLGARSAFMALRRAASIYMEANEDLKYQVEGLWNVLAVAIGPVVEKLVSWLTIAISYINAFVKALWGVDLVAKANALALKKQEKATKDAAKASNQLAGFDEMNKLSDTSSSDSGATAGAGQFEAVPVNTQFIDDIISKLNIILPIVLAIAAGIAAWKIASFFGASLKDCLGWALLIAGAVMSIYGFCDAWINGLDWGNFTILIAGLALAVGGATMLFGDLGTIISLAVAAIAMMVLGVKDFIDNGPTLQNTILIIGGAIALAVALATAGLSAVVAAIVAAVAAIAAFTAAILLEEPAIMSVEEAQENLTAAKERAREAEEGYIGAVDAAEASMKKLAEAEKKAGITGEELYAQVQSGTLDYANMTDAQKEVYKAYLDNEQKQKDLKTATEEFNKAKKAETMASYEHQLALAKESGDYDSYKKAVIDAFEKGELSADEARELIGKSMSEMSDDAQKTFMEDIPSDIKNGLDPSKYETTRKKIGDWFSSVGKFIVEKIWDPIVNWWNSKVKPIFTKQFWAEKFNAIKEGAKSAINGIISVFESGINWIIRKINKLSWKMPDWMGGHKFGFDIKEISIPRLAKGGIVNNPGRGVPVIAGEAGKEAVLPLENNTEWMDTLAEKINGGAARIVIPIYLHGRKIAEEIIDLTKQRNFATNGAF